MTPIATETRTYQLVGGWVKVDIGTGFVELVAASPEPGFTMRVESRDGNRVKVEFVSAGHESEFEARWNDGEFEIDIEEHTEGDDDSSSDD